MKTGFRIDIQSDLNDVEMKVVKSFCDSFIVRTLSDPKKRYGGATGHGGRDTPYSRGSCMSLGNNLYFRRINRHKRIFGAIRENTSEGESWDQKMKFKDGVTPNMFTYAIIGDIKG